MAYQVTSLEDRIAEEQAKGYRGARVDPEPNSAYSQESDPTTSPRAPRHGSNFMHIDEFADPANPEQPIADRRGLDDPAVSATLTAAAEGTVSKAVAAVAVAADTKTTKVNDQAPFDGTITGATFTPLATITGDPTDFRTFTLRNTTKGLDVAAVTSEVTLTQDVAETMTLTANVEASLDDKFSIVETVDGTGVAHGGGTVIATFSRTV